MQVYCQECNKHRKAVLATGCDKYPHRPDLKDKRFWECDCGSFVGCHPNSENPLGTMAGRTLRRARSECHSLFDPMWRGGSMGRKAAYRWLAKVLNLSKEKAHISMLNIEQCKQLAGVLRTKEADNG